MSRTLILNAALKLAEQTRYDKITRDKVAKLANVADGSINYYFKDMDGLKESLITFAVDGERWGIVAQALMDKHPATANLTPEQRTAAMAAAFA